MFGERRQQLLKLAAAKFKEGTSPFNNDFLVENNATVDECMTLSDDIALVINSFLACPQDAQTAIIVSGTSVENPASKVTPEEIWLGYVLAYSEQHLRRYTEQLGDKQLDS